MFYIGIILVLTVFCIWLHWRQISPARLYAAAAAIFFIYGAVLFWPAYFPELTQSTKWFSLSIDRAIPYDTYFFESYFQTELILGTGFLVISLLIWGQQRLGAMLYPGLTRWLLWPLLISMLHVPAVLTFIIGIPRRNIEAVDRQSQIFGLAEMVIQIAILCLLALTLWSLLKRFIFARIRA